MCTDKTNSLYYKIESTLLQFRGIDINIPAHSKVGFVGTSGSGKTTTVDVILGLLEPQEVMEAVNNLGHEITIIMIAHRLSTLRQCDQIYLLERGEVKAQGTFNELAKTIGN